jgi:hypothetical protein
MKCGKETQDGQLFCARCLEAMEAYPVKPDTHIQLPVRNVEAAPKKQTRKVRGKDAQIAALRLQNRLMWVVILTLVLAIVLLAIRSGLLPG